MSNLKKISLLLYFISLFIPIFSGADAIGIFGIISGFLGFIEPNLNIFLPWISNFIFLFNLNFDKKIGILKYLLSVFTIIFSLFTLGISKIPLDEGGAYAEVKPGIGFLFWILSFIVLFVHQIKNSKD